MALFGGNRDASLFRHLNKELINDIIDTEIYYYKIIIDETKTNMYGEGKDKTYYSPIKIPTLIDRSNAEFTFDEFGTSYTRGVTFAFLRDTLVDKNVFPEIGDVIEWNNEHFIVDSNTQNQFVAGKNPDTWDGGDTQGYNVSIILNTHTARKSQLKIRDDFRFGINDDNNDLPIGI
tara:strand:- start:17999 stop:18526 length:528 start_codon:yes stop_codon:yes gene_type:complete